VKYPDYGAFVTAGRDDDYLAWAVQSKLKGFSQTTKATPRGMVVVSEGTRDATTVVPVDNPNYQVQRRKTFNIIWDRANLVRHSARWWASTLYFFGIACFISIIIYNALTIVGIDILELLQSPLEVIKPPVQNPS
jgi:hypothetical protein